MYSYVVYRIGCPTFLGTYGDMAVLCAHLDVLIGIHVSCSQIFQHSLESFSFGPLANSKCNPPLGQMAGVKQGFQPQRLLVSQIEPIDNQLPGILAVWGFQETRGVIDAAHNFLQSDDLSPNMHTFSW
jgi:hypothetical protein